MGELGPSGAAARTGVILLVCIALFFLSACKKTSTPAPQVTLHVEEAGKTYRVGPESITLKLNDSRGQQVTGAQVELEGNMTHAGMAPVFGQAVEVAPGTYRGNLQFSMAGDWIISVRARLSDGQQVEQQFEVRGVRSE